MFPRLLDIADSEVREKVARAMRYLPPQVLPPVVTKADPDSDPIMTLVMSSPLALSTTLTSAPSRTREEISSRVM